MKSSPVKHSEKGTELHLLTQCLEILFTRTTEEQYFYEEARQGLLGPQSQTSMNPEAGETPKHHMMVSTLARRYQLD